MYMKRISITHQKAKKDTYKNNLYQFIGNSVNDQLNIIFLYSPEKRICKLSPRHGMSNPFFFLIKKKKEKNISECRLLKVFFR